MGNFCDSPMNGSEFYKEDAPKKGTGSGEYDGCKDGPFGEHGRTSSPNAVPELTYDKKIPSPTGEKDQF